MVKYFLINLDVSTDRLERFDKESKIENIQYTRIEAVNGKENKSPYICLDSPNHAALISSNLKCFKYIVDNKFDDEWFVIFEDDAHIKPGLKDKIENHLSESKGDIVWFDGRNSNIRNENFRDNPFLLLFYILTCIVLCYLVFPKYLAVLSSLALVIGLSVIYYISNLPPKSCTDAMAYRKSIIPKILKEIDPADKNNYINTYKGRCVWDFFLQKYTIDKNISWSVNTIVPITGSLSTIET